MGPFFLSGRSLREDYLYKERGSGREKAFSSYLSRDINLCWTNWPCCEDNVTAGVSAETEKNQSKVKEKKTHYCIDSH